MLPYEFVAHTYSSLAFAAELSQASFEVGAKATLTASLTEYQAPARGPATVWVEVRSPGSANVDVVLLSEISDRRYLASYAMTVPGVYRFRTRARGETMKGTPYEREKTLTGVAVPGGDRWSPEGPERNPVCDLLRCVHRSGVISGELQRRLRALGIDVHALIDCCERECRRGNEGGTTR
jgi:hypothetical protein